MDGARVAGSAMRRRERRLRSWAKHERMTVAMALAENLHHSRQKVEGDEHDGLRAQKTARVTGARPGVLTEPEPQGGAVTVGYVADPKPLLVPPVLGGGDTLDDATVSFLLAQALLELQEMEDAAKRREEQRLKRQTVEEAKALRELLVQTERKMATIGRHVAAGSPVSADDLAAWQSWNAPEEEAEDVWDSPVSALLLIVIWVVSTAPCIWQSLVLFVLPEMYSTCYFLGDVTSYSALLGLTVDTSY